MHSEATYEENAKSCRLWLRKASGCRTLQESDVIMLIFFYGAVGILPYMVVGNNIGGSTASSSHRFVVMVPVKRTLCVTKQMDVTNRDD